MTLDFRRIKSPRTENIDCSGKIVGGRIYWKLYSIENILRIILCSILSIQHPSHEAWWEDVLDKKRKDNANFRKSQHLSLSWKSSRGNHGIYYVDIKDLVEIMRNTQGLLSPVIGDVDGWMTKIEGIRMPRNVVAHMNFPTRDDQRQINSLYKEVIDLLKNLQTKTDIKFIAPL